MNKKPATRKAIIMKQANKLIPLLTSYPNAEFIKEVFDRITIGASFCHEEIEEANKE